MTLFNRLKKHIPFELKRGTSLISIILTLIIIGILNQIGVSITNFILGFIKPNFPSIFEKIMTVLSYKIEFNVVTIIILIFLLFPIYRLIDKRLLKRSNKTLIFMDNFAPASNWHYNYWESGRQAKTNRIENGKMIFEARPDEIKNPNNAFGAFIDITNGIYKDQKYEISCKIRSENDCTMKFQLWLHDTNGINYNVKEPTEPYTPKDNFEIIKTTFIATETNALRIHLHNQPGNGKIIIDNISVIKI